MEKELKINIENAVALYNNTNADGRELSEHLFGREIFMPKDIKERVKTFEDACKVLGNDNQAVVDYFALCDATATADILAFAQLRVIAEALNEGWQPCYDVDECRYYPWFYIFSKEEYDELDKEEKATCRIVGRSSNYANALGGIVYAHAYHASLHSHTHYGSRLAFKTRELAEYCGKKFIEIWEKYMFE